MGLQRAFHLINVSRRSEHVLVEGAVVGRYVSQSSLFPGGGSMLVSFSLSPASTIAFVRISYIAPPPPHEV